MTRRGAHALLLLTALLAPALAVDSSATRDPLAPRLVRVTLGGEVTVEALLRAGLDLIEVRHGRHGVILEWPGDEATLVRLGAVTEVMDSDPGATAARRAKDDLALRPREPGKRVASAARADGVERVEVLPPFGSGSMGGHWTLEEIKMKLDDLVASDVNDVVADKIDTIGTTLQGRPIWGLKLGKTVPEPDNRPVAFFNSLTHAREPAGMQTLLYFADDLVTRYGADPMAAYLLDHRVIYLVPLVNPDGYMINQAYYIANGGTAFGFHRKNARDTNDNGQVDRGPDGVDLNRNYGYQWGFNNAGSSPTPTSETYRGPAAFSEPETQAQRDIVAQLQPKTGFSFHTYGDLKLHPWGWTPAATTDSLKFYEWSDDITLGNGYHGGQGIRVLYEVNGDFGDWAYGETTLKPRMFAWIPELGSDNDGFWAPASRILPIAMENLGSCYYVAAIAGPHVRVEEAGLVEGALNRGSIAHLSLRVRNKGLAATPGPDLTATLTSLSAGAHVIQGSGTYSSIGSLQSADLPFQQSLVVAADDTVTLGRVLRFQVNFTDATGFFSRDTIDFYCGTPTVLLADDAEAGIGNWSTMWSVGGGDPYRPGSFFQDSPILYGSNWNRPFTATATFNLSQSVHAYAAFLTRWDFEADYDCGLVEASFNGTTWTPVPARASVPGINVGVQPTGAPIFEGSGRRWRAERADLSAFSGPGATSVRVRLRTLTDGFTHFDGFRVDSVRIITFDPSSQPAPVAVGEQHPASLGLATPFPNPARDASRFSFALPRGGRARLEVIDTQGRRVRTLADQTFAPGRYEFGWDLRDAAGRRSSPGLYLLRLTSPLGEAVRRVVVL